MVLRRLAIVVAAAVVLLATLLNLAFPLPGQETARPWAAGLMAFPVAAALVLVHRPGNPVGRLLGLVAAAAGIIFIGSWTIETWPGDWSRPLEALQMLAIIIQFWAIISLLYVFPDGVPATAGARWAYRVFTWWMGLMLVVGAVRPGPMDGTGRENPFGLGPSWLAELFDAGIVVLPLGVAAGVVVLVRRRQRAGVVERAQLKWFTSAAGLVVVMVAVIALVPEGTLEAVTFPIVVGGFWALPAAIVVAVLRYRLFEIDRILSRTVSYGVVVAVLTAVYVVAVYLVSSLLPRQNDLAVAVSTLTAAALFRPLTHRTRAAVDRRFNRAGTDRRDELARFADRLRDPLDPGTLTNALVEAVGRTIQPAAASVWLRVGRVPSA